jgi:hypothetical protein
VVEREGKGRAFRQGVRCGSPQDDASAAAAHARWIAQTVEIRPRVAYDSCPGSRPGTRPGVQGLRGACASWPRTREVKHPSRASQMKGGEKRMPQSSVYSPSRLEYLGQRGVDLSSHVQDPVILVAARWLGVRIESAIGRSPVPERIPG